MIFDLFFEITEQCLRSSSAWRIGSFVSDAENERTLAGIELFVLKILSSPSVNVTG